MGIRWVSDGFQMDDRRMALHRWILDDCGIQAKKICNEIEMKQTMSDGCQMGQIAYKPTKTCNVIEMKHKILEEASKGL